MQAHSVPLELRGALALGILRARVEKWETVRRRTLGEFPPIADTFETNRDVQTCVDTSAPVGPLLSAVLPNFLAMMEKDEGWRGQTLAQSTATYRMFLECCGDRPVAEYQRKDLAKFYDLLRGLPALYSKRRNWSGRPLSEIVESTKDADHPRLTMKTVKRHFSALGRLFSYLKRRGEYTGENPAHGFEFPNKGRARDKRRMWEGEALRRLFASPVWTGCLSESRRSAPGPHIIKDEKYWLPILALFHGNRLEEFAQLRRGDVRCEDGIWYLDINDDDTKQVKDAQSKRRVPVHPRVQQLGFLEYVETAAAKPDDQVFPQLRPGGPDGKLGYFFTKWWTRYRKDIGLYEKGLDYHAFRGSVATKLAAADVSLDIRNELLGHEGKSVDERVYQKGLPLAVLATAIVRIEWAEFVVEPITADAGLMTLRQVREPSASQP